MADVKLLERTVLEVTALLDAELARTRQVAPLVASLNVGGLTALNIERMAAHDALTIAHTSLAMLLAPFAPKLRSASAAERTEDEERCLAAMISMETRARELNTANATVAPLLHAAHALIRSYLDILAPRATAYTRRGTATNSALHGGMSQKA